MTRKTANPTAAPTIATDLFRHIASSLSWLPLPTPNQTAAGLPKKSFVESSVYRKPLSGFAGTCRGKPTLRDWCRGSTRVEEVVGVSAPIETKALRPQGPGPRGAAPSRLIQLMFFLL